MLSWLHSTSAEPLEYVSEHAMLNGHLLVRLWGCWLFRSCQSGVLRGLMRRERGHGLLLCGSWACHWLRVRWRAAVCCRLRFLHAGMGVCCYSCISPSDDSQHLPWGITKKQMNRHRNNGGSAKDCDAQKRSKPGLFLQLFPPHQRQPLPGACG